MSNKEILKKEIGIRVKEIRENRMHMNKNEFAKLIGMQNQYLGTVESGKKGLTVEKAVEICNKTDVSADFLLRGIDYTTEDLLKKNLSKYNKKDIDSFLEIMKNLFSLLG